MRLGFRSLAFRSLAFRSLALAFGLIFAAASVLRAEAISHFTLDNGLQVVVIEDHRAPVVVQMIWYRAGAADEPAGKSGIAHFLEHLMFKGTEKIGPEQFSAIIEANGGSDNAFTSWDYTAYFQRIAADRLEMIMEMEADRMRNLRLTDEIVLPERDVILEERAQRTESDPGALMSEQMRAALYQNHRYGVPIIGWRHEIATLTRQDALEWYQRYYAPNNATLVIAGDTTPEEVRALAEKYYGPLQPSEGIGPRLRPQEPPHLTERRLAYEDSRVSDPYVQRIYLAPKRQSGAQKEAAALEVLAELLGGSGQTSYMARKLQFESQIAVYSGAYYSGEALDSGTFGLIVMPSEGVSLQEAETALDQTLEDFLAEGIDAAALERVKVQLRGADIYAQDSARARANLYGANLTVGLSIEDIQSYSAIADSLTAEDILQAARKVLDRRNAVTAWLSAPQAETAPDEAQPPAAPEAAHAAEDQADPQPEALAPEAAQ